MSRRTVRTVTPSLRASSGAGQCRCDCSRLSSLSARAVVVAMGRSFLATRTATVLVRSFGGVRGAPAASGTGAASARIASMERTSQTEGAPLSDIEIRRAVEADLRAVVALLSDDAIGSGRERLDD